MIEGWNRSTWNRLSALLASDYAGYKPEVAEAPNGDAKACDYCAGTGDGQTAVDSCQACGGTGRVPNIDAQKRYLHVAEKYSPPAWARDLLARAHYEACRVAEALHVPATFYPRVADGTLRVLEYPAGAGSAEHTDFDLFTIVCWRETPEDLERTRPLDCEGVHSGGACASVRAAEAISPGLHIGEIGELVGLGPATPHRVPAREYAQRSIVYFAIPDHGARLLCPDHHIESCGPGTVGEWLKERMARSRVYK